MSIINNEERIFKCDKCETVLEVKRGSQTSGKITVFIVDEFKTKIIVNPYQPNQGNQQSIKTNHFCSLCWDFHKEKDNYLNKKQYQIHEENYFQQITLQTPEFEYVIDDNPSLHNPSNNNPNQPNTRNNNNFNWKPWALIALVIVILGLGTWLFMRNKNKNK